MYSSGGHTPFISGSPQGACAVRGSSPLGCTSESCACPHHAEPSLRPHAQLLREGVGRRILGPGFRFGLVPQSRECPGALQLQGQGALGQTERHVYLYSVAWQARMHAFFGPFAWHAWRDIAWTACMAHADPAYRAGKLTQAMVAAQAWTKVPRVPRHGLLMFGVEPCMLELRWLVASQHTLSASRQQQGTAAPHSSPWASLGSPQDTL